MRGEGVGTCSVPERKEREKTGKVLQSTFQRNPGPISDSVENFRVILVREILFVILTLLITGNGRQKERMSKSGTKVAEARKKLGEVLREAERKGCSALDISGLPSVKRLLESAGARSEKSPFGCRFWALVAGVLVTLVYTTNIHTVQGFSSFWLKWTGTPKDELCTISMPDQLTRIFRPPVSCSICRGVTQVEKLSKLSPEEFEERYAYSGRPVVITDGMTNWTAQHVFSFEFFRKIYTRRMDQWRLYNCQFFPYNTEFRNLEEVLNMSEERAVMAEGSPPWYVGWSNCDDEINQILRRHYERPYFLPETAETKKLDWIFMGSTGFGAPMHVDNVEHPSWQAQLRGRKKWSLRPPPECFYDCRQVDVVVEPGEIIVLDTNRWYHSTLIVSKEMSITIGAEYD